MATDILSRYYTENIFSSLLISSFQLSEPKTLLELGVGAGSLLKAAQERWENLVFVAADIDEENFDILRKEIPNISLTKINGLAKNLGKKLNLSIGEIDIAVCNPPYQYIHKKSKSHIELLNSVNFKNTVKLEYLTTDIIFFIQNLKLLKDGGELGIILPDTLLSGEKFRYFRKDIIEQLEIISITQLPENIFRKTEALTHILLIRKENKDKQKKISLRLADTRGKIISKLSISQKLLEKRMDFNFHKNFKFTLKNSLTLDEIGAKIFRGRFSKKKLEEKLGKDKFFHLDSFDKKFDSNFEVLANYVEKGDILLARVGKRCLGRIHYVVTGPFEISDCIIAIRVKEEYQKQVLNSLLSKEGQLWLKAHAHGVCSKFVSQSDLKSFPINSKK